MGSLMLLLLLLWTASTDRVASQSQGGKLILKAKDSQKPRNPCEGYILVQHKDTWGFVGFDRWSANNADVVCRSVDCGRAVRDAEKTYVYYDKEIGREDSSRVWINDVVCDGTETNLWDCSHFRGWGVSNYYGDTLPWITCSKKIEMTLDGFKCAGAVQFNVSEEGGVPETHYVCNDNWGNPTDAAAKAKADLVCQNLNCGNAKADAMPDPAKTKTPEGFLGKTSKKQKLTCPASSFQNDKKDHLWQCDRQEGSCSKPAFVTCDGHPDLRLEGDMQNACSGNLKVKKAGSDGDIWEALCEGNAAKYIPDTICRQLHCGIKGTGSFHCDGKSGTPTLTCEEKIKVVLKDSSGSPTNCYGYVYVNSSKGELPVCGTGWNDDDGDVVCRELGCGKRIFAGAETKRNVKEVLGLLDNVECKGDESKLWHCKARHDDVSCQSSYAYVTCANSIGVRLSDGPGRCAGNVEIQHDGVWKTVAHSVDWTDDNSKLVCNKLGCGGAKPGATRKSLFSLTRNERNQGGKKVKVKCEKPAGQLSDCIKVENDISGPPKEVSPPVNVTCEGHKVLFLLNGTSCSGHVAVEHNDKDYWLSASNDNWNQRTADVVCGQLHCGTATDFNTSPAPPGVPGMESAPWYQSYTCSSSAGEGEKTTSVFDCDNATAASNQSIAFVNCTGTAGVTTELSETCWGHVKVTVDGTTGGVCAETWTQHHSNMLCGDLNCGLAFANEKKEGSDVTVLAMALTKKTRQLTESIVVKKNRPTDCDRNPAFVVCTDSVKADFDNSTDRCSGNVMVRYKGQRRPLCKDTLGDNVKNAICRELQCGDTGKDLEFFGPPPKGEERKGLSGLTCDSGSNTLAKCKIEEKSQKCPLLAGLKCDKWQKFKLEMPHNRTSCQGDVTIHDKDGPKMVSSDGWTPSEGTRLCKDLQRGGYKSHTTKTRPVSANFYAENFTCSGDEKSIWGCKRSVASSPKQGVFLECSDNPEPARLSSPPCAGELTFGGKRVCAKNWKIEYSQIVCRELQCFDAVSFIPPKERGTVKDTYHVQCDGHESNLGQCKTVVGDCEDGLVSVHCRGGIQFRIKPGLVACGGAIQVKYKDEDDSKWQELCLVETAFDDKFKNKLCKELRKNKNHDKCAEVVMNNYSPEPPPWTRSGKFLSMACEATYEDIKDCVKETTCTSKKTATVYCQGYDPPTTTPTTTTTTRPTTTVSTTAITTRPPPAESNAGLIAGASLGAVGATLVLLLLLCLCLRRRMFKWGKKAPKDLEYDDSGEYEDVEPMDPEMKAALQGPLGSKSESPGAGARPDNRDRDDVGSDSSQSYDDIDDQHVGGASRAAAAHGPTSHDYINTRRPDTVTYEVENAPGEDDEEEEEYDDVDTVPDIRVTPAQIHPAPLPHQQHAAAVPLLKHAGGGAPEEDDDGDYLEPDKEG